MGIFRFFSHIKPYIRPGNPNPNPGNPSTSSIVNISVTYKNTPSSTPSLAFHKLLYGKQDAHLFVQDDGWIGGYTQVYPAIVGGTALDVNGNPITYSAKTYDDGTGTRRIMGFGFAMNGTHHENDDTNPNRDRMNWRENNEMVNTNHFCDINHSFDHNANQVDANGNPTGQLDPAQQLRRLAQAIYTNVGGRRLSGVVLPAGMAGFVAGGEYNNTLLGQPGYEYLTRVFWWSSAGYGSNRESADGYPDEVIYDAGMPWSKLQNPNRMLTTRYTMDNQLVPGEPDAKGYIDRCRSITAADSTPQYRTYSSFSHEPYTQHEGEYFDEILTYLMSTDTGNTWYPTPQARFEYQRLQLLASIKNVILNGNIVNFTVDLSAVADLESLDFSINGLGAGGEISSVVVTGADSYTINKLTGLLNIDKKNIGRNATIPAATVTGTLPVNIPLDLLSTEAPPLPLIHTLFTANNGDVPPEFYGLFYNPVSIYQDFPEGMNPIISGFTLGQHFGSQTGREMKIYGVKADGSEDLLVTDTGLGDYSNTPYRYDRLRYLVNSNGVPQFIRVKATYTPVADRVLGTVTKYPLANHTGTVVHPYSLLEDRNDANNRGNIDSQALAIVKKLKNVRVYVDNNNINQVQDVYTFNSDRQGYDLDALFQQLKDNNVYAVWCMQAMTDWLNASYPNPGDNYERVPVPYGADRSLATSFNAIKDWAEQITIRYGRNTTIPVSRSKSKTGYFYPNAPQAGAWKALVGLGTVSELEIYNEIDKWWKGLESYCEPEYLAVLMGVVYDAVKAIDPTMIVSFPGIAYFSADYLKAFVLACKKLRGIKSDGSTNIPCDKWNYHYYPSTAGSQYSGQASTGLSIEGAGGIKLINDFLLANKYLLGNLPVACGEIGVDSTTNSPLRAVVPSGSTLTQRQWAAVLYLRVALAHAKYGIQRTFHYEWGDNSTDQYTQFAQMGMTQITGTAPNRNIVGYPNYNLLAQLGVNFGDYTHSVEQNSVPTVDLWINSQNKKMLSLHLPDDITSTTNFVVNLPNGGVQYTFSLVDESFTTLDLAAGNNTIACTEMPTFITFK